MTHFRKRLNAKVFQAINEWIAIESAKQEQDRDDDDDDSKPSVGKLAKRKSSVGPEDDPNQGTLLLDATCAPADIAYPTDITLLNDAREKLEEIIDVLHDRTAVTSWRCHARIARKRSRLILKWPSSKLSYIETARTSPIATNADPAKRFEAGVSVHQGRR